MSHIDQAGSVGAHYESRRAGWPDIPYVTVAMNRVEFHEPVFVGDVVSFYTRIVNVGHTSITIHVSVETLRGDQPLRLTEAEVTYVAVRLEGDRRVTTPIRGK